MSKKYVGIVRTKKGDQDRIYYSEWRDKFTSIKSDGTKRHLTKKQKEYLRKRFAEYRDINIIRKRLMKLKFGVYLLVSIKALSFVNKYHNVLLDIPKIIKEQEFDDVNEEVLVKEVVEYINKNDNFNDEQKKYLIQVWSEYLFDYGDYYDTFDIIVMLNNLSSVDIKYKEYRNDNIAGKYISKNNEIIIYVFSNSTLFHETIHCSEKKACRSNHFIAEGYAGAVCEKYCNDLTYHDENEYLLLISEIIGKEKVVDYIINCDIDKMIADISKETSVERKEIKYLFDLIEYYTIKKIYHYATVEELKELNVKIKKELANLAIKANEENENNFIVKNALENNYKLETSFLEEEYLYFSDDLYYTVGIMELYIDNSNKFEIGEEVYGLSRSLKINRNK